MRWDASWLVVAAGLVSGFAGCAVKHSATQGAGGATAASASVVAVTVAGPMSASSTTGGGSSKLGNACAADGDCDPGMRCVTAKDNDPVLGGGAVNGYCTKDCLADGDCAKLGVDSPCITPNGASKGECFLGCTTGPALTYIDDPLEATKCHGREDLRCSPVNQSASFACLPVCGRDSQCAGRKCDPRTGSCVDTPHTGAANGTKCDPNVKPDACAGFCQGFSGGSGSFNICATACVLGGPLDGDDCGGLTNGLCIYSPSKYGAGDFGRCARTCKTQDDCYNPNTWCRGESYAMGFGYCLFTSACTSDADCKTKGTVCATTKLGKFCLDLDPACASMGSNCALQFPLGMSAP